MTAPSRHDNLNLTNAYNMMLSRIKAHIDKAQSHSKPTLQQAINIATTQALLLDELSPEEAKVINNYIKHDINDAAETIIETCQNYSDWLMLDMNLVEHQVLEYFLATAHNLQTELSHITQSSKFIINQAVNSNCNATSCDNCKPKIKFHSTPLSYCRECNGTPFFSA